MSEQDDLDRMLTELMNMAQKLFQQDLTTEIPRASPRTFDPQPDEVLDGRDSVTYILHAPGHELSDFDVSIAGGEINVTAEGVNLSRRLPARVDGSSAVTDYRNGILSVRVKKK